MFHGKKETTESLFLAALQREQTKPVSCLKKSSLVFVPGCSYLF